MTPYYDQDGIKIYHGDCREVLPNLSRVGSVITDPPYSINTKSDGVGKINPWADYCNAAIFYSWWLKESKRVICDDGCVWSFLNWRSTVSFQKASCDVMWPIESMLIWDKCWIGPGGMRGLRPSYEMVALWANLDFSIENRALSDVQAFKWSSKKPFHPAEKPVSLMQWLIETTPSRSMILDPFMGSGSTLRAAKDLGRPGIGIEINESYCEIAAERLRQGVLF